MVVCNLDDECPFMYYCTPKLQCQHKPVFPIELYPAIVYILIPIGAGLVNVAGKSMGLLKVTLLMNLLRYNASRSTALIQPMVAGSALPNIMSVLLKKHPKLTTSLIDSDVILLIIPCSLLGSTVGSFIQKLLPQIVKDLAIIAFFILSSINFYRKSKQFNQDTTVSSSNNIHTSLMTQKQGSATQDRLFEDPDTTAQRQRIMKYQQTVHLWDIIINIFTFLVFQGLVLLVQGKFWFYHVDICSWQYFTAIAGLILTVIVYQEVFIRKYLLSRHKRYKQLSIKRNYDLSVGKNLRIIYTAGFFAGLIQGILGVGSGTFIMGVFMVLNFHPRVAAATSSFQILFIGLAAFTQQFVNNNITIQEAGLFFTLTFIGGGLVTILLYWIFSRFQDQKVSKFLVRIMFGLCVFTAIFMIPYIVQLYIQFGSKQMISIKFHC